MRHSYSQDKLKARSANLNTDSPQHCGKESCSLDCRTFSDWGELKSSLRQAFGLEDVSIQLRPDYLNSENIDCLNRIEVREISANEVLLSLSVGLRVSLDVHLIKHAEAEEKQTNWKPRDSYRSILMCAKGVFCRTVRDRVVDMMSARGRVGVVSFFLDAEGRVESCSNHAREFCDTYFTASKGDDDFFPQAHWEYLQGAIKQREFVSRNSYRNESLVFCFHQESGMVDCLLQKMGETGYLLSLALDR